MVREETDKSQEGVIWMKFNGSIKTLLLTGTLLGGAFLMAQDQNTTGTPAPADNTRMNQRDRDASQPTADQQKENRSDRDITQQVRRSIVKDKSLSTYAHNVKIITQNGQVTLRGPVRSEEEKRAVEAKAAEVAGDNKVTSELDVKSKQ
jgi:osmotically-inducible protein OsmY